MDKLIVDVLKEYPDKTFGILLPEGNNPEYSKIAIYDFENNDYEHLLTLEPVFNFLKYNLVNSRTGITEKTFYSYIYTRITNDYHKKIKLIEQKLSLAPQHEQRTPEWFAFRENLITGSEVGYLLGKCGDSAALNAFKGKIGLPNSKPNPEAPAIQHGVNYENVAKRIYELRNNLEVLELGCVQSANIHHIGASPDGIVFKTVSNLNSTTFSSWSKYGRMLEIKCPYSRIIDKSIKPEYEIQILQQQFTCGLPICDFLECGIIDTDHKKGIEGVSSYSNYFDMLKDKFDPQNYTIQNPNIPICNLTKEGYEKGIIIVANIYTGLVDENGKKEYKPKQYIYPLEKPYVLKEIVEWIQDIQKTLNPSVCYSINTKTWKVYNYSVKTVVYNKSLYENIHIPQISNIWNNIKMFRNFEENDRMLNVSKLSTALDIRQIYNSKHFNYSSYSNNNEFSPEIKLTDTNITNNKSNNKKFGTVKKSVNTLNSLSNSQLISNLLDNIDLETI
jgi:putative phage-type endonuclease